MILSIKHIVLCRVTGPNTLEYTALEPLFNGNYGIGPPSDLALDYRRQGVDLDTLSITAS